MYDYDVVCIGGGPGGSASAMRCADRGKKVAIIEARARNGSGGTCVNRGCIPTKALMASANLYASIKEAKTYGINVDMSAVSVDFKAIDKRKNAVINGLGFGLEAMLWKKSRGIDVIKGRARLLDAHTIEVDNGKVKKTVTAENIVVAVGSEPAEIAAFNVDHKKVITSNEIMDFSRPMPGSIVIIGSGAIGLEYGHIYSIYGVDVTIVDTDGHAPDEEVLSAAQAVVDQQRPVGVDAKVTAPTETPIQVSASVTLMDGAQLEPVKAQLQEEMAAFLKEIALNTQTVSYAKALRLLLDCAGVADVTGFTLNGGDESLVLAEDAVGVCGEILLQEVS